MRKITINISDNEGIVNARIEIDVDKLLENIQRKVDADINDIRGELQKMLQRLVESQQELQESSDAKNVSSD